MMASDIADIIRDRLTTGTNVVEDKPARRKQLGTSLAAMYFGGALPAAATGALAADWQGRTPSDPKQLTELLEQFPGTFRNIVTGAAPSANEGRIARALRSAHAYHYRPTTNDIQIPYNAQGRSFSGTSPRSMVERHRPSISYLAHELAHSAQPALRSKAGLIGLGMSKAVPALAGIEAGASPDERTARGAAVTGLVAGLPTLALEAHASTRAVQALRKLNTRVSLLKQLRTFAGLPTYASWAATPLLIYALKKHMGGYAKP